MNPIVKSRKTSNKTLFDRLLNKLSIQDVLCKDKPCGGFKKAINCNNNAFNSTQSSSLILNKRPENYTCLNQQYRMRESLMEFSNIYFYNNQIRTCFENKIKFQHDLEYLKETDLVFVNLFNTNQKQVGTSYKNERESKMIMQILKALVTYNKKTANKHAVQVKQDNIGIMSFYRKQIEVIKDDLKLHNFPDIECNTVDAFQGREKEFIILSTVKTDGNATSFLSKKQRCNVALTRAKYGLIIIGDKNTLHANKIWKEFCKHIQNKPNSIIHINGDNL